jgi:hypothetical protein
MNYAALLGVLAAVTFTLPLLALLAESLGLHRNAGVTVSLLIAVLAAAVWYIRSSRVRSQQAQRGASAGARLTDGPSVGATEEDNARL